MISRKLIIEICGVIILVCLAFNFIIVPSIVLAWHNMVSIKNLYESKKLSEDLVLPELMRKNKVLSVLLQKTKSNLEIAKERSKILDMFHNSFNESKVSLIDLRALPEKEEMDIAEYPYSLKVTGRFHEMGSLINSIEKNCSVAGVQKIEISSGKNVSGLLNTDIEISFYSRKKL